MQVAGVIQTMLELESFMPQGSSTASMKPSDKDVTNLSPEDGVSDQTAGK